MARRPLPPLNALRAFEVFARHGRMIGAAEELCVTHGAVSRQVRLLQESLGVELVRGPRNQLELTEAGRRLAAALTGAFDGLAEAASAARGEVSREIEISCPGTFALKWLIPRLPRFVVQQPEVRVRILESYAPVDFRKDSFHGAIRFGAPRRPDEGEEATVFLADHHHGPVAAPALSREGMPAAELLALPRLISRTFPRSWEIWAEAEGIALPPATVEREFAHNYSLIEAAAAGLGAAVTPWAFVAPDIEAGRLVAPLGFARRPDPFVFLRPRLTLDPAVDAFRDWLVNEGARTPPAPSPEDRHD